MSSFWWGQSALDELIEKATSELLPAGQVDLALHLEISDQIRSKKVNAKDAMKSLKQRLGHKNPNVILATLSLVDTCMKNSGSSFVKEVATRDFMEEVTHLIKVPTGCNQDVKQKVLYLIQVWGIASKGNSSLSYISGTYSLLRAEGYTFPPITERIDSILLETAVAPEWTDSDCCERCRTPFTLTNRKHHCRQCGATFCQQCSSKNIPLPHLGINDTVRVCDGCYIKVKLSKVADKDTMPHLLGTSASISSSLTPAYTPSIKNKTAETITTATATLTAATPPDDQFEDDLKKAIEISLKESEQQKKLSSYVKKDPVVTKKTKEEEEEEANLAAAISASLKDMELSSSMAYQTRTYNSNELSSIDMENIQLFSTLIQRVRSMGGDISGDNQINKLYTQIGTLQPKLVKTLDETSQKHDNFVQLHEKLNKAVKAYDVLLEQRLLNATKRSSVSHRSYYGNYNTPSTAQSYNLYTPETPVQTQQPYSYSQNYNLSSIQQTPIPQPQSYTPITPTTPATNTMYQASYAQYPTTPSAQVQPQYPTTSTTTVQNQSQYPAISTSTTQAQQQLHYPAVSTTSTTQAQQQYPSVSTTPAQQNHPPVSTAPSQQSYPPVAIAPAQQQYSGKSSVSVEQQHYTANETPAYKQYSTPSSQQQYTASSAQQQYSSPPIQQQYTTPVTSTQQSSYQQYQYPSVTTIAPSSNDHYYSSQQSYYTSQTSQPVNKQSVEEAPLIEL